MKPQSIVLLWLAYVTEHNVLKIHLHGSRSQNFLLFKDWVIFHYVDESHTVYPFIYGWTNTFGSVFNIPLPKPFPGHFCHLSPQVPDNSWWKSDKVSAGIRKYGFLSGVPEPITCPRLPIKALGVHLGFQIHNPTSTSPWSPCFQQGAVGTPAILTLRRSGLRTW